MKINILIINILAIMFVVLIFIMALTFIIFHFQDASTSLKDTWSTTGSFFGGIATLTAAYIASKLFNDWRDQKKYEIISNLSLETYMEFIDAKDQLQLYLFQADYKIKMEFSDIDTAMFKAITKLNLLDNILVKFNYSSIKNLIEKFYHENYCKMDIKFRSREYLTPSNFEELKKIDINLNDDAELLIKELLNCIALIDKD